MPKLRSSSHLAQRANVVERLEPRQLLSAGDLDTTFRTTGQYIGGTSGGGAHQIAVQSNGNFLVATGTTNILVSDYSPSAQLLASFDAMTPVSNIFPNGAMTVAVQNDDKVLVGGGAFIDLSHDGTAMVARFQSTGQLDTTWNGTGLHQLTLPGVQELFVASLAIQKDGKVIAAGGADGSFFVARFTTNGTLDSTFDGDGIKTFSFPQGTVPAFGSTLIYGELARGVAVQDDGKIVVGGLLDTEPHDGFQQWLGLGIARLNPDGALDNTFGTGGEVVLGAGTFSNTANPLPVNAGRLTLQPDGRIVMSAVIDNAASLLRFNTNGTLDNSFDQDGVVTLPESDIDSFDFLSNGQMMVVSASGTTTKLRRINQDGSIDGNFGTGGVVTTEWNIPSSGIVSVTASALTVQPDGKVIVGVQRHGQLQTQSNIAGMGLARYLTNVPGPSISGTVSNDANNNGVADAGESAAGVTVYLDRNQNGALDSGEPSTTTDASGQYQFANLLIGSYDVREVVPAGWVAKTPATGMRTASVIAGDPGPTSIDFLNALPAPVGGSIAGVLYDDANNNAKRDAGELGVAGITIYNDANNNSKLDTGEKTTTTDSNGVYALTGLSAGSYKIRQILQSGWSQTTPAKNYGWTITLATNQSLTGKDFGTKQSVVIPPPTGGSISGTVFNDLDGDRAKDSNEAGVGNITIYNDANNNSKLDAGELTTTTDSNGAYMLANLSAGSFKIREILQNGWSQTTPTNNYGWTITLATNQQLTGKNFGTKQSGVAPPSTGSISGISFNDNNKNGAFDGGDVKTSGKTVFLDTNNNGKLDSGEKSVVSDANGNWSFTGLSAGTYHVRRVFPSGYTYSTTLIDLTLNAGGDDTGLLIGSKQIV